METKDLVIHPIGETKKISTIEQKKSLDPYEQQVELFSHLEAWCSHAIKILAAKGYSGFSNYGGGVYELIWLPESISIKDQIDPKIQAADDVLRAIHELHEAIFQDDIMRIANVGIQLGIAVAVAHSRPYEVLVRYGEKIKEGQSLGGEVKKESEGIKEKLRQIKSETLNITAKAAWYELAKSAEKEETIWLEGIPYSLGVEYLDETDLTCLRVISINDKTGMPDGRGVTQGSVTNKFGKI